MPLKTERRCIRQSNSLQRAVKQRAVRWFDVIGQRRLIDRETVILAGNHDPPRGEVLYRMVGAVMAKFHLVRAGPGSQCQQLVTEANPKHRDTFLQEDLYRTNRIVAGLRITGTVG